jgi:hypothetical protein
MGIGTAAGTGAGDGAVTAGAGLCPTSAVGGADELAVGGAATVRFEGAASSAGAALAHVMASAKAPPKNIRDIILKRPFERLAVLILVFPILSQLAACRRRN